MPSRKDHIDQARHNEQFFSCFDINTTPFLDWVVSGIFYSALHYVDSYLSTKGKHPITHGARTPLIHAAKPDLGRSFFHNYMSLKDDSQEGRYNMRTFTLDEIRRDILPLLDDIKRHLRKFIPEI